MAGVGSAGGVGSIGGIGSQANIEKGSRAPVGPGEHEYEHEAERASGVARGQAVFQDVQGAVDEGAEVVLVSALGPVQGHLDQTADE